MITSEACISVIIPAYYAEDLIGRAIDSVLNQTQPPEEILVVADRNTDGTASVARSYGAPVRFVHQENCGVSAARNLGIAESTREWVAFLDADDWWVPERLERQFDILSRHPELRWLSGRFIAKHRGEEQLQPPDETYRQVLYKGSCFPDFYEAALRGVRFHTSTMLIHRFVFGKVGTFDPLLKTGEDIDLWYRIADHWPHIGYVDRPLSCYDRREEGSLTRYRESIAPDLLRIIAKRIPPGTTRPAHLEGARECFFEAQLNLLFRLAIIHGQQDCLRRIMTDYKPWLSPPKRIIGVALCRLSPFVYGRLVRFLRLAKGVCAGGQFRTWKPGKNDACRTIA